MGIDARIDFKESRIPINDLSYELGLRVGSNWFDHPIITYREYGKYFEVRTTQRYWGPGYERGYWPAIAATLEICMIHTYGLRYYGDTCDYDEAGDFNDQEFVKLHAHFLTARHSYLENGWRSFSNKKEPPVDMYGHPMVCNGGGPNKLFWHSAASSERVEKIYD